MADYDSFVLDLPPPGSSNPVLDMQNDVILLELPTPGSSNPVLDMQSDGWYSQSDSRVVVTNHYHKRGWRTESNAYVEWESTNRNTPYPGEGTVEPSVGTVVFQWTTYSNGQQPT
jgi:hypothetical protein